MNNIQIFVLRFESASMILPIIHITNIYTYKLYIVIDVQTTVEKKVQKKIQKSLQEI